MEKSGLVLEGGGMRGAYTAGALHWLCDHDVYLDYSVGISSGAVYLASYLMKDTVMLHDMPLKYAIEPANVGIQGFLTEGRLVAYHHLFDIDLKKKAKFDIRPLKEANPNMELGAYDLNVCKTIWFGPQDLDEDLQLLKASCTLPIAGNAVNFNGHKLLDGGITTMIPIERSIEQGCTKHLVITTKPADYVRKPVGAFMRVFMKMNFMGYPTEVHDYAIRHENYARQVEIIDDLVKNDKAMLVRPSETIEVSRYKGDPVKLEHLYKLGYDDMENRKEELAAFLGREIK